MGTRDTLISQKLEIGFDKRIPSRPTSRKRHRPQPRLKPNRLWRIGVAIGGRDVTFVRLDSETDQLIAQEIPAAL
ncbi:MAG: hypothetical protein U0798_12145 [Gemmataceae bacterium]